MKNIKSFTSRLKKKQQWKHYKFVGHGSGDLQRLYCRTEDTGCILFLFLHWCAICDNMRAINSTQAKVSNAIYSKAVRRSHILTLSTKASCISLWTLAMVIFTHPSIHTPYIALFGFREQNRRKKYNQWFNAVVHVKTG